MSNYPALWSELRTLAVEPQPFHNLLAPEDVRYAPARTAVRPARPPAHCTSAEFRAYRLAEHAYRTHGGTR